MWLCGISTSLSPARYRTGIVTEGVDAMRWRIVRDGMLWRRRAIGRSKRFDRCQPPGGNGVANLACVGNDFLVGFGVVEDGQ